MVLAYVVASWQVAVSEAAWPTGPRLAGFGAPVGQPVIAGMFRNLRRTRAVTTPTDRCTQMRPPAGPKGSCQAVISPSPFNPSLPTTHARRPQKSTSLTPLACARPRAAERTVTADLRIDAWPVGPSLTCAESALGIPRWDALPHRPSSALAPDAARIPPPDLDASRARARCAGGRAWRAFLPWRARLARAGRGDRECQAWARSSERGSLTTVPLCSVAIRDISGLLSRRRGPGGRRPAARPCAAGRRR